MLPWLQGRTGLDYRFSWSPEFPLRLRVVVFIFIAFGYSFAAWALVENRFFSRVVRIQKDLGHVGCCTGPYQFVRQPGYVVNILSLFGIVLALGSICTLIVAGVSTILTVIRTVLEDHFTE